MNTSESDIQEQDLCEPLLNNSWLYPIIGWFVFTFFISGFSLLYAAIEARKKHIEIEEAYEQSDTDSYYSHDSDDEGYDISSPYEKIPDEYMSKRSTQRRSQGSSLSNGLGQIIEDEEEETEDEIDSSMESEKVQNNDQSSDESEVEIEASRFTKYRGSISGKGKSNQCPSDHSDEHQDEITNDNKGSSDESYPQEISRNSSFTPSIASLQNSEFSKETSISEHHHHSRNRLKVPNVRSRSSNSLSPRCSVVRTESQNRADFLLKMMAKGGDYRTYRSRSPDLTISPKISPTGRKISMDMKPRSSSSHSLSIPHRKPRVVESDDNLKKLDHVYVNLPEGSDPSYSSINKNDESTSSPTEEIRDITTTSM